MKLGIQVIAFVAYATLFDVHSVICTVRPEVPGPRRRTQQAVARKATGVHMAAQPKRAVRRFLDGDGISAGVCLPEPEPCVPPQTREDLMESCLHLDIFFDVRPALAKLS